MTLAIGTAPFVSRPSGGFDFDPQPPEQVLHVEPSPRRARAMVQGLVLEPIEERLRLTADDGPR